MFKLFNKLYIRQLFVPNILSILINPFYFIRRRLYKSIKNHAELLHGKILDIGCGRKPYQHLFTHCTEYIGIDIENPAHDHSKEDVDKYYDGKNIPYINDYFDNIFCSEVLEHIFEPDITLKEAHRVLKNGGLILLTTPFTWDEHEIPFDYGRYTSFGIKYLFEKNGFEIITVQKSGHYLEVLFQLFIMYLHHLFFTKNKYFNILINSILIMPFTILGIIITYILPRRKLLYFNNIVLAKKV